MLTGESFPVEKRAGELPPGTPLARRTDRVFLGTNIRSGTARAVVVATGRRTELGAIAHRLTQRRPETELDRGLRRFGSLLTIAMLLIVLVVFAAHVIAGRPPVETLLFAIALAVGLSPELLPAILSINLARGAEAMARRGVLVRFLDGIENLGSMDVLCTDKTGTLTEGVVAVEGAYDPAGARADEVLELAAINAAREEVKKNGPKLPPAHLRDSHYPGAKELGRGEGYVYPHDVDGGVSEQSLMPEGLEGLRFYEPTRYGFESELARRQEAAAKIRGKSNKQAKNP